MYPPPIKHECYRKQMISCVVSKYILPIYPLPKNQKRISTFYQSTLPPITRKEFFLSEVRFELTDLPPHQWKSWNLRSMWHLVLRSKWHFGSGWCTPPPRNWNWTKHECYRKKAFQERSSSTFYNLPPHFPIPLSDSIPEQETGEFQFQMNMDIWTLTPSSSPKNEMLLLGLRSTLDDWLGWSMDLKPIRHLSPAKKMKCSFLDYVQLLMIGRAGQ